MSSIRSQRASRQGQRWRDSRQPTYEFGFQAELTPPILSPYPCLSCGRRHHLRLFTTSRDTAGIRPGWREWLQRHDREPLMGLVHPAHVAHLARLAHAAGCCAVVLGEGCRAQALPLDTWRCFLADLLETDCLAAHVRHISDRRDQFTGVVLVILPPVPSRRMSHTRGVAA